MAYLIPIKTAFFVFPLIALLFTIPFILHQYHKYGSINKFRVLIIYSFILYLITIYFLVILPLPNPSEVTYNEHMVNLIPFSFITDFIRESSIVWTNPNTYLKILKEPCFYTVILNIFMTIPFGMYLRYYFKCSLKKTIMYSFFLSLFFEITQLTGLYHLYKYPYRVFDVDDLLMNTLGGVCGFYLMGIFSKNLPTRDKIDLDARLAGQKVSGLRRITLFCLDLLIYLVLSFNVSFIIRINHPFLITFIIYYIFIPVLTKGKTIGGKFLNVRICYNRNFIIKEFLRIMFLYLYYFGIPIFLVQGSILIVNSLNMGTKNAILIYFITLIFIIIYLMVNIISLIRKGYIYYDKLFKVEFKSTIEINYN
ncbi:MAG: VanZ family protein [Bacilli bacterium]|nr:VanZ family protein [Bacilli bacterium]